MLTESRILMLTLLVLATIPLFPLEPVWIWILTLANYYALLALSWNLLTGYTGQFSFAHTGLLAVGGYTSVLLHAATGIHPAIGLLAGGTAAAVVGFSLGLVSLRLKGIYLALTTFGFSMITYLIVLTEYELTGGKAGFKTSYFLLTSPYLTRLEYYYVSFLLLSASLLLIYRLINSRYGLFLQAIREDEEAAASYGIHLINLKVAAFVISSLLVGMAGSFYAHLVGYISPAIADLTVMSSIITVAVLGGLGTLFGPLLGGFIVWPLSELIRAYSAAFSQIVFAIAIILTLKFFPNGLVGLFQLLLKRHGTPQRIPSKAL